MMHTLDHQAAWIPVLGYGTFGMSAAELHRVLPAALASGFCHIDTAQVYRNEAAVGDCIAASGIPRSQLFVTTKMWVSNYTPERFGPSVEEGLRALKSDYIDLLLLHWPSREVPLADQIERLNEQVDAGKVRYIGVSNYNSALLRSAASLSHHRLLTHQFEYHPFLNQAPLIETTRALGMVVTAYCAMAIGRVFTEPALQDIAAAHGRSVAQVVLRWLIQQPGVIALSRTVRLERLRENVSVFDFELTVEEMVRIQAIARPHSRIVDPPGLSPVWDFTG